MSDPDHARPFDVVPSLALDATLPLMDLLDAPKGDAGAAFHPFLKQAVEYAGFAPRSEALWKSVHEYAWATLKPQVAEEIITWIEAAFTGYHPSDTDLSGWLMAIDHFDASQELWSQVGMSGEETLSSEAFLEHYAKTLDEDEFEAALDAARGGRLSDWDKRMHQAYAFVYFDRQSGADPFLVLKFVHQGQALRRAIETFDFAAHPSFPHDLLKKAGQLLIDKRHVWMPDGKVLEPLMDLA